MEGPSFYGSSEMADLTQSPSKGFFDYLEDAIPKLVLAPTFLAALIFIYGFILWTAWISMTQSALLPSYKISAGYRITNNALDKMRAEGVSENIIKKLRSLEARELTSQKSKFLRKSDENNTKIIYTIQDYLHKI